MNNRVHKITSNIWSLKKGWLGLPCAFHLSVGCFSPKIVFALSVPYQGQAPGRGKMAPNFIAILQNAKFYNFTVSQNSNRTLFGGEFYLTEFFSRTPKWLVNEFTKCCEIVPFYTPKISRQKCVDTLFLQHLVLQDNFAEYSHIFLKQKNFLK